ncbi:MAG: P-type conjugative transfer protein TrbG, partial [Bradyrhizobium sp.]|nr:P-type conjugative transfer protein TrbG [Bradyrhizobium sp.]
MRLARSISARNQAPACLALLLVLALSGCTTFKPPQISYDGDVPPPPDLPAPADDHPRPLHVPPAWTPARGGNKSEAEAKNPADRIEIANDVA